MRSLAIAYGNNRQAKTWANKTITYDELKDRLKVTIRTSESAEEYAKMKKADRDLAKDHGGFVAGSLAYGRPIISHEIFNLVHELRQKRKLKLNITSGSNKYLARYVFSGKLYCGNCHSRLKKHDRHKKDGAYVVWCCTKHIREIKCCPMKAVKEEYVKLAFLQLLNKLKATYAQILTPFIKSLRNVNSKDGLNKVIELEEKKLKLQEQEQVLSKLLAGGYIEMDSYYLESNQLKTEMDTCLKEKLQLSNSLNGNLTHLNEAQKLQRFVSVTEVFCEFKDEDFLDFVDDVVVKSRTEFIFRLKCGLELEEEVKETWHTSHMVTE